MAALSVQRVVLLAAHLASQSLVNPLEYLASQFPIILPKEIVYGILLQFLPESINPQDFIPLLIKLHNSQPLDSGDIEEYHLQYVSSLSDRRVAKKIARINLKITFDNFILLRCRNIDVETGLVQFASLLSDISIASENIRNWNRGIVRIVEKLVNVYEIDISIIEFETMDIDNVLAMLFQVEDNIVEIMRILVYPYLSFKDVGWDKLQNYFNRLAVRDLVQLSHWRPPKSTCSVFVGMLLTAIYASDTTEFRRLSEIQPQLISYLELEEEDIFCQIIPLEYTACTTATASSLHLLNLLLTSAQLFVDQHTIHTLGYLLQLRLSNHEDQSSALVHLIRGFRNRKNWRELRDTVTWLRSSSGVLGRLEKDYCEKQILSAMLSSHRFNEARDIYILSPNVLLSLEEVQHAIDSAFLEYFDNATSMKSTALAQKVVSLLQTPNTAYHNRLLSATQKLSTFKLQQNDISLLPVQVRLTDDPLNLISRVLQLNTRAYTQKPLLQSIMSDLDPCTSYDENILEMTIEAALSSGDFQTAYELSKQLSRMSWKSYYQIGKYPGPDNHRLEVLAKSILTCPPEILSEILDRFRNLEQLSEQRMSESEIMQQDALGSIDPVALPSNAARKEDMDFSQALKTPSIDPKLPLQSRKGIKDAVASKFTSGIGWVLGADRPDMQK
ncbi:Protein transport protein sec39 [Neolecta irregularis DAH-3]|uniref:Protein transport protein sec39 n=1 Tax=Neolecta irregularis (strain DAH-3) TaxID=1198029 RepID=A0A1U7LTN5_NEOID|nr:Protein transport protein sec39 [Neolecta irregularis DAH-3]|eukprot:OLL26027.1 Protein transport protein sec39 [Neolecta irregularis DAH-3]